MCIFYESWQTLERPNSSVATNEFTEINSMRWQVPVPRHPQFIIIIVGCEVEVHFVNQTHKVVPEYLFFLGESRLVEQSDSCVGKAGVICF